MVADGGLNLKFLVQKVHKNKVEKYGVLRAYLSDRHGCTPPHIYNCKLTVNFILFFIFLGWNPT